MIVNVEVLEYGSRNEAPVGRVIEVLGAPTISHRCRNHDPQAPFAAPLSAGGDRAGAVDARDHTG